MEELQKVKDLNDITYNEILIQNKDLKDVKVFEN